MAGSKKTIDPRLSECFASLSKPAQRALIEHMIFSEANLSHWSRQDMAKLHGIGPSSFTVLDQALADAKLEFKA